MERSGEDVSRTAAAVEVVVVEAGVDVDGVQPEQR